jgi:spermidine synthase
LLAAYVLSGCAALIYEVVWTRLLTQQLGQSVWAVSTVLGAFMGGMGAGALAGGALVGRCGAARALHLYAGLEGVIAVAALAMPLSLAAVTPLLAFAYTEAGGGAGFVTARLASTVLLLFVPTFAMGATYPLAARAAGDASDHAGSMAATLYAGNTAGACAGAALAGFSFIPLLGLHQTTFVAVTLNLTAAGIAVWLATRAGPPAPAGAPARPVPRREHTRARRQESKHASSNRRTRTHPTHPVVTDSARIGIALSALVLTGFAALAHEVAWTRVLALTIGPTTYAFSMMLALFILGLAAGSAAGAWVAARVRRPMIVLAAVLMLAGAAALAAVPQVHGLTLRVAELVRSPQAGFGTVLRAEFALFAWLLLPIAAAFGAAFPLALRIAADGSDSVPRRAALLYGANTLGAIAGSLAAGFVLVPRLGVQRTIEAIALLTVAAGILLLFAIPLRRWIGIAAVAAFAIVGGAVWKAPRWDVALLSAGAYKYAPLVRGPDLEAALSAGTVLFNRDGAAGTVTVRRLAGALTLAIDGKVDASNAGDMQTQKLLAHVPLMLHTRPRRAAIIGLGSGVTLGAALRHPLERVDSIEISTEVVSAAGFFANDNNHGLADPRSTVIVGDGRTHLLLAPAAYDVIISEPSNPWMAGVASLFAREFFLAARRALAPDGIVCQWAHAYDIKSDDLRSIVATFSSVFPHGTMWLVGQSDILLVASGTEIMPRLPTLLSSFARPGVAEDLARVAIVDAADVLAMYAGGPAELQAYAAGAVVQTDDRNTLEFSAPRAIVGAHDNNLADLRALAAPSRLPPMVAAARTPQDAARWAARGRMYLAADAYDLAREAFEHAVALNPDDQVSVDSFARAAVGAGRGDAAVATLMKLAAAHNDAVAVRVGLSRLLASTGDFKGALDQVAPLVASRPQDPRPAEQAASVFADAGDAERLRPVAAQITHRWPDRPAAPYYTGMAAFLAGRLDEAERVARQGITQHPTDVPLHTLLGVASASLARPDAARAAFEKTQVLAPRDPAAYTNLGLLDLEAGAPQSALRRFAEGLILDPSSEVAIRGLAQALRQTGQPDRAARVEQTLRR